MPTRRHLMLTAALAGIRPARAAPPPEAWSIVTEYPATAIPGEGIAYFAAAATGISGGVLDVRPRFDAPDGLRSAGMLQAVAEGRVTAADAFTGALAGAAPIFQLSSLPFLTGSAADTARLLAAARPAYQAALGQRGLALLYATPWPPTGLWSKAPVPDAAALRGLRVRTYDAASTEVLAVAGADPAQMSFADALPRLRAGSLDAVLSSGDGGAGARLWELLPHFTVLDYAFPLSLAFCAQRTLSALPADVAAGVAQAGRDTEVRQFAAMATRVAENEARMRQQGVQMQQSPDLRAALTAAAGPVIAAWTQKAGPEGQAILDAYRSGSH